MFVLQTASDLQEEDRTGDIILDPQELANVFSCVITSNQATTSAPFLQRLFEEGILDHNQINEIWSGYDARLRPQFLRLFHKCELAYELFNADGQPKSQSLIPSLLPESEIFEDEQELRRKLSLIHI